MYTPEVPKTVMDTLAKALEEASAKGAVRAAELRVDPEMLLPDQMAERLGISVLDLANLKTEKKIMALPVTGSACLLYPAWQLGEDGRLLPGLHRVLAQFEYNHGWRVARFLLAQDRYYLKMLAAGETNEVVTAVRSWNQGAWL